MSLRSPHLPQAPGRPTLGWGVALALTLIAGPAAGQTFKTARGDLLVSDAGGRSFVEAGDHRVELPLSKAARVSDLRSVGAQWVVAAVGRGVDGPAFEILTGRGAEIEVLGSPAVEPAAELVQPIFIADSEQLHGLVWLAGDAHNQLAVQAARRTGDGWAAPETLSPPGKGTQIALSAAVLADGSWLVVWTAFDGRDDEILWSRRSGGAWSQPRPVAEDNGVPDITPHLFATAGGALVAWSRYDGNDYRVHVARFDGEGWSRPKSIGPRGSTAPAFSVAEAPYLIYRQADPGGWAVIELDGAGRALREAAVAMAQPQRPVLATVTGEGVTLEWLGLERKTVSAPLAWTVR